MPLILPNDLANDILADGEKLQQNFATVEDWGNQEAITHDGATGMTGALLLAGPPTQPDQAATKGYVDAATLVGELKMWPGDAEPANWMFCRGQAVSRATYSTLFSVIGSKFGGGDGTTTFNLPNYQGRVPIGYYPGGGWANAVGQTGGNQNAIVPAHGHGSTGTVSSNHTHNFTTDGNNVGWVHSEPSGGGGFMVWRYGSGNTGFAGTYATSGVDWQVYGFTGGPSANHVHSGSTGGISDNHTHTVPSAGVDATNGNLPPFLAVNYIIKVT